VSDENAHPKPTSTRNAAPRVGLPWLRRTLPAVADETVVLRAITEGDLPFLQGLIDDPAEAGSFMWQGFRDPQEWRRRWGAGGLMGERGGVVLVLAAGEPAGFVSWDQSQWFGRPCWSLGVQLASGVRGRGVGTRVHELIVSYLFAETVLERIEAYTDADNVAERRALEKAGFELEGTLRRVSFRAGQWHDGVLYSVIRQPGA
jgi:RimJ/RimL family protein N-acetyltransferase